MTIYIGENVRRMRAMKGLTQEELAEFLGVSFQAVSKWERGLAYPDIEIIPAIANFFDITIDELMGSPRIKAEQRINDCLNEYDRLELQSTSESYRQKNALAKAAYDEFPYDWRIINMYLHSLVCGRDAADFGDTRPTIRFLCEKILESCTNDYFRQCAVSGLLKISENTEDEEKWLALLNDDFCILRGEKREEIAFERHRFDEALRCCQKNLCEYLSWLLIKIDTLTNNGWVPSEKQMSEEQRIMINEKVIKILQLLFENGDFGGWTWNIACKYEENARSFLRLGKLEEGIDAFEKSVVYWLRYDELPEKTTHTSVLFENLEFVRDTRDTADVEYKSPKRYLSWIAGDTVYDGVRENERFREAVKRLEKSIK